MATVVKNEISKAFEEAIKKSGELLDGLKAAYAKEKDDLDYTLSIYKRDKTDEIDEEIKAKRAEIETAEKEAEDLITSRYKTLTEKEQFVAAQLKEIESIPGLIKTIDDYKQAVAGKNATIAAIEKDNKHAAAMSRMEYERDLLAMETQINGLLEKNSALTATNAKLEEKLEEAYKRITEMANNTATASANSATISALKEVAATKGQTGK